MFIYFHINPSISLRNFHKSVTNITAGILPSSRINRKKSLAIPNNAISINNLSENDIICHQHEIKCIQVPVILKRIF